MKHLTRSRYRINRFSLVAFILVMTLAFVGLSVSSVIPAKARPASSQRLTAGETFYWGSDTGQYKANPAAPLYFPNQDYYIGQLGSGLAPAYPGGATDANSRAFTLAGTSPETTYAYWTLLGPNPIGGRGGRTNSEWGSAQAQHFMEEVTTGFFSQTIHGNVLFGDIEGTLDGSGPGTWSATDPTANMDVVNGFLNEIAASQGFAPGIYTGPGFWGPHSEGYYFGQNPKTDVPFVLWLSSWLSESYYPTHSTFPSLMPEVEAIALDTFSQKSIAGYHPSIWQFGGDAGDVTTQVSTHFVPQPVTRGFYPDGIHVDYYNDVAPAEITLEAPINWDTFTPPIITSQDVATINYAWYTNSPAPGVNGTFWSAIYSGMLLVPAAGTYTFYLEQLDDGGRLFVNDMDNPIIDKWRVQGPHYYSATINLPVGQVPIKIQYAQGPGNEGSVSLSWSSDAFEKELIGPASAPVSTPTPIPPTPTPTPIPPTPIPPTPIPPTPIPPTPIPPTPVPTSPPVVCGWEGCFWVCRPAAQAARANQSLSAGALSTTLDNVDRIQAQAMLLYHVRDAVLSQTAGGQHYIDTYYAHSAELAQIMLSHADVEEQGLNLVDLFTPNLQALADGQGSSVTITTEQVQQLQAFLDALLPYASPEFQQAIAGERARRPLEQLVGLTMDQAWENLNQASTPTPTATPSPTPTATPSPTPTATPTLTPSPTPTATPAGYPVTITGLRSLLKDLRQAGLVDRLVYTPMDQILMAADQLLQHNHKAAALGLLRVFQQLTQAQSGHHITPGAAQQLLDLDRAVMNSLR